MPMVGFGESIKTCFARKYATLQGRACRSEYWWFFLFQYLAQVAVSVIGAIVGVALLLGACAVGGGSVPKGPPVVFFVAMYLPMFVMMVVFLSPNLCAAVRRLHDRNRSGWWLLAPVFPCVGMLAVMAFLCVATVLRPSGGKEVSPLVFLGGAVCFISLVAFYACVIWMIVWLALPGTKGENRFGPDPLVPPAG